MAKKDKLAIEDVIVRPFPHKKSTGFTLVKVVGARSGVIVGTDAAGRIYSSEVSSNLSLGGAVDSYNATFRGLVKLGLISAESLKRQQAVLEERARRRDREYAAKELARSARRLGIKLTKAQHQAAVTALGGGKSAISAARIADAGL
jgi:hypothetical protein